MEQCHERAFHLCCVQKEQILPLIEGMISDEVARLGSLTKNKALQFRPWLRTSFVSAVEMLGGWYGDDLAASPVGHEFGLERELALPSPILNDPYFEIWLDKVDDFYVRLVATLFHAKWAGKTMTAGRWWRRFFKQSVVDPGKALEIAGLLTVQFRDEIRVVPDPRSIAEAVEIGHSEEMHRLRQKIFEWIDCMEKDKIDLGSHVRREIKQASEELRRLKRYREFSESPLIFGTKLLLDWVPGVSQAIKGLDVVSWAYERRLKRQQSLGCLQVTQ